MDLFSSAAELIRRIIKVLRHPIEGFVHLNRYVIHAVRLYFYGLRMRRSNGSQTVGVLPHTPLPLYVLWSMAQVVGLHLVPEKRPVTFLWIDKTTIPPADLRQSNARSYINGRCLDIRKTTVAKTFENIFGYQLTVDPKEHAGLMVEKSETNGSHTGRIVSGPLRRPKRNCSYQKLIDNRTTDGRHVADLRVVIVGTKMPMVLKKQRPIHRRFESGSFETVCHAPEEVFAPDEQQKLLAFSHEIGIDFGELDVLRDNDDQQLYVVDANKTCISPPIEMPYAARFAALQTIARAFEEEFLAP